MSSEGLKRLKVWVAAKQLALDVYARIIPLLPAEEKWGLAIQLKRSVSSIPANIAEGYGRYYYQDNVHFCLNARGSLEETISHLILASELGFIPGEVKSEIIRQADILVKMINGYIAYLRKTKQELKELNGNYSINGEDIQVVDTEDGFDYSLLSTHNSL